MEVFIILVILFVWLGWLTYYTYSVSGHYNRLVRGVKKEDLTKILGKDIEEVVSKISQLDKENKYHIQKVSILRFNPFSDTGGDQSFVLSILDGENTGIVLTSLHSRGTTRWYAKNVRQGKGVDHELSMEEKDAIKKAVLLRGGEK